jgi:putative transposase
VSSISLRDADRQALQASLHHLAAAFGAFSAQASGYPGFSSRHACQSIQYPQRLRIDGRRIHLPKVGWVKIVGRRPISGRIKSAVAVENQSSVL